MKLSAQEEYGLRCLLQLARQEPGASRTIEEISQAEGISYANVAKLLRILRQGGFVDSVRGQHGGYALARPAGRIAVAKVLALLGGPLFDPSFCEHYVGSEENCTHSLTTCSVRALWSRVQRAVDEVLKQTTLQDLIRQGYALQGSAAPASELLEIAG